MTQAKQEVIRVFYVLGTARGGTGILARILSKMHGAVHTGELRKFWSKEISQWRSCHCEKSHKECPVLSELLEEGTSITSPSLEELRRIQSAASPKAHSWWSALKILARRSLGMKRSCDAQYVAMYSDLHRQVAKITGAALVAENSKNPADAALLVDAQEIEVYLPVIVRDPRAVLYSTRKRSTPENPSAAHPLKTVRIALWWMARNLTFQALRLAYGKKRSFLVTYEELMANPNVALRAACELLNKPDLAEPLEPGEPILLPEVHGPDGDGRFKDTEVTLRKETAWQRKLHPADRILATILTLPLLLYYGYPVRLRRPQEEGLVASRKSAAES